MINIQNLGYLREAVEAAPDHLLHMGQIRTQAECGTAYCALGWGTTHPKLSEQGLIFNGSSFDLKYRAQDIFGLTPEDADILFAFGGSCGAGLAHKGHQMHRRLEVEPHAITKQMVLDNIDRLVRGENPIHYGVTLDL